MSLNAEPLHSDSISSIVKDNYTSDIFSLKHPPPARSCIWLDVYLDETKYFERESIRVLQCELMSVQPFWLFDPFDSSEISSFESEWSLKVWYASEEPPIWKQHYFCKGSLKNTFSLNFFNFIAVKLTFCFFHSGVDAFRNEKSILYHHSRTRTPLKRVISELFLSTVQNFQLSSIKVLFV